MKHTGLFFVFVTLLFVACDKKNPSSPSGIVDLSTLSGKWNGTVTIIKAGQCLISDGDSASYAVMMTWSVNKAGEVTIQDSPEPLTDWNGKVETNLNISLRKFFSVNCFGTPRPDTTIYNGTIKQESGIYKLNVESIEEWCPEQGCIFHVRYSIFKR